MNLKEIKALPHHVRLTIPDDYLDIFEHMNVQYYLKIFNNSVFDMFVGLGMDADFFETHQVGLFAVENRLSYRAEVKAGHQVATYSRLIARSHKGLHFMLFMVNETQGQLAATMEALAFHVSRETKRSTPFLDAVIPTLDNRLQEHQALAWNVPLSQAIRI